MVEVTFEVFQDVLDAAGRARHSSLTKALKEVANICQVIVEDSRRLTLRVALCHSVNRSACHRSKCKNRNGFQAKDIVHIFCSPRHVVPPFARDASLSFSVPGAWYGNIGDVLL